MTIKKTARAMSVALLLVVAGLVVYGIRVIPALKSGVSWETLTPELAGVLWIAVIFTAVLRRARTDEPVARVPAMVCEWALLVLGLVALSFGAWDFGQLVIAAQNTDVWAGLFADSGISGELADKVAAAVVWQENVQQLLWVIFHACMMMLVPSALSGLALMGFGEKARATGLRFMLTAIGCGIAAVLLAPMLIGSQISMTDLLASRKAMGLILAPMLIGESIFFRTSHVCTP